MPMDAPPIPCLPLILICMTVVTIVLVHMGSHQQMPVPIYVVALREYGNQIPPDDVLDALDLEDLQYLMQTYLARAQVTCDEMFTAGSNQNKNFFCSNRLNASMERPCVLYSFGYRGDFSFEKDVSSTFGCRVFSFDPKNNERQSPNEYIKLYDLRLGDSDRLESGVMVNQFSSIQKSVVKPEVTSLDNPQGSNNKGSFNILKLEVDTADQWDIMKDITRQDILQDAGYLFIELNTKHSSKAECMSNIATLRKLFGLGFRIYLSQIRDNIYYKVYLINPRY